MENRIEEIEAFRITIERRRLARDEKSSGTGPGYSTTKPWEQRRGKGAPPLLHFGLWAGAKKKTKPLKICFLFEETFVIIETNRPPGGARRR